MIASFFITLGAAILAFLIGFLPEAESLPAGITEALDTVFETVGIANYLFPVATLLTVVGVVVLFEIALWTFHGGMWIWRRLTGR